MPASTDAQALFAPAYIEIFKIDLSTLPDAIPTVYYVSKHVRDSATSFNGNVIQPWPIEITGVEANTSDAPARPTLTVGNLDGSRLFGTMAFAYGDLVGATVTYYRTFQPYLASGASLPPLKYTIARKLLHNRNTISVELRSPQDSDRALLPHRQILKTDFPGVGLAKGL